MSNLEWIGIIVGVIVLLSILIAVGLGVMGWAHGFTPHKDPTHSPQLRKMAEIPHGDQ